MNQHKMFISWDIVLACITTDVQTAVSGARIPKAMQMLRALRPGTQRHQKRPGGS